jgi:hypothetical protein
MSHRRSLALWQRIVVPLWVFSFGGCANVAGDMARDKYLSSAVEAFEYARPAADLWAASARVLHDRGFELLPPATGSSTAATRWQGQGEGRRTGYVLHVEELGQGKRQVRMVHGYESTTAEGASRSVERDWSAEWELLQELEPAAAHEIQLQANQRAQQAYQSCAACLNGPPPS